MTGHTGFSPPQSRTVPILSSAFFAIELQVAHTQPHHHMPVVQVIFATSHQVLAQFSPRDVVAQCPLDHDARLALLNPLAERFETLTGHRPVRAGRQQRCVDA